MRMTQLFTFPLETLKGPNSSREPTDDVPKTNDRRRVCQSEEHSERPWVIYVHNLLPKSNANILAPGPTAAKKQEHGWGRPNRRDFLPRSGRSLNEERGYPPNYAIKEALPLVVLVLPCLSFLSSFRYSCQSRWLWVWRRTLFRFWQLRCRGSLTFFFLSA